MDNVYKSLIFQLLFMNRLGLKLAFYGDLNSGRFKYLIEELQRVLKKQYEFNVPIIKDDCSNKLDSIESLINFESNKNCILAQKYYVPETSDCLKILVKNHNFSNLKRDFKSQYGFGFDEGVYDLVFDSNGLNKYALFEDVLKSFKDNFILPIDCH
jgi:hypothetical protein